MPSCGLCKHLHVFALPRTATLRASSLHKRQSCRQSRRVSRHRLVAAALQVRELPIFPLNVVAFPSCVTALNIFEARYRVLFNTLLAGEDGLEEGLIQHEAKHVGSKQFGMCYFSEGGMASVGTTLKIDKHVRFEDGRMFVNNIGVGRFRVLKVLEQRPVLMCLVEVLEEGEEGPPEFELADEVRQNFKDLLLLNAKAKDREPTPVPEELDLWGPTDLSYYIASLISESPLHQQVMLEENSTKRRLESQKALLTGSVGYLRARIALEGAFKAPEAQKESASEIKAALSQEAQAQEASQSEEGTSSTTSQEASLGEAAQEAVQEGPTEAAPEEASGALPATPPDEPENPSKDQS